MTDKTNIADAFAFIPLVWSVSSTLGYVYSFGRNFDESILSQARSLVGCYPAQQSSGQKR